MTAVCAPKRGSCELDNQERGSDSQQLLDTNRAVSINGVLRRVDRRAPGRAPKRRTWALALTGNEVMHRDDENPVIIEADEWPPAQEAIPPVPRLHIRAWAR